MEVSNAIGDDEGGNNAQELSDADAEEWCLYVTGEVNLERGKSPRDASKSKFNCLQNSQEMLTSQPPVCTAHR